MDKIRFRRHGDVNFHPITKEEYEAVEGKKILHQGSYIVARGEATGSTHVISIKDKNDMEIIETDDETRYVKIMKEALITHTHDHEIITFEPGYYKQVPEREMNHFADSIVRKITD